MGDSHTCGVKANGNLLCWGANDAGQIGDTTNVDRHSPVVIGSGWASVVAGFSHTCALRSDSKLYCWGDNTYGALGFAGGSVAAPHEVP
jgi:alpha-tubulin suppressor-like RCC1 family protein